MRKKVWKYQRFFLLAAVMIFLLQGCSIKDVKDPGAGLSDVTQPGDGSGKENSTGGVQSENELKSQENLQVEDGTQTQEEISPEDAAAQITSQASLGIAPPPVISNVESLDHTSIGWGIGKDRDEQNRPLDCLKAQEKYAAYEADFYKEGSDKIYLTFDEGYEIGYTEQILDTLKEHQASAVFFITMQYAKEEPELIERMIREGHILGNHSAAHPAAGMPSLSIEDQQKDVTALNEYVKENYGYDMVLFRFPSGKFSEQSIAVMNNLGLKSIFWSFAHYDYNVDDQPDPAASLEKMKSALHPGAIYLLHAVSSTDTQILGDFIEEAEKSGFLVGRYDE